MKGLLFVFALLAFALTARHLHLNSDTHLANKSAALTILQSIPDLKGVAIESASCEYLAKNSITSLDCQFTSPAGEAFGNGQGSGWTLVSQVAGMDPWRRPATMRSFRKGNWIGVLYLSTSWQLIGASLVLAPT
jgi:hypothetical protein